jgi:hypothetical protein
MHLRDQGVSNRKDAIKQCATASYPQSCFKSPQDFGSELAHWFHASGVESCLAQSHSSARRNS